MKWIRQKAVGVPTAAGWVGLAVLTAAVLIGLLAGAYPFLRVDDAAGSGVLVIEGWVPDYALQATVDLLKAHPYERVYSTGGPIHTGRHLSEYGTWADMSSLRLQRIECPVPVHPVPAPEIWRDRTLESARTLARRLRADGILTGCVDVVTLDLHARRTRLLFQRALGPNYQVGIHPVGLPEIGPGNWFACSEGVRSVIAEWIAYLYARLAPGQGRRQPAS